MNARKVCRKCIACYQNALKMNGQKQNAANQELPLQQEAGFAITDAGPTHLFHPQSQFSA